MTYDECKIIFDYFPETGELIWLPRSPLQFTPTDKRTQQHLAKWWNSKSANKKATFYSKSTLYLHVRYNKKDWLAHRIIWLWMTGEWPKLEIDHKNGIRTDNRWDNLQDVTRSENMKNKALGKNNKSGSFGVFFDPRINKWCAQHKKKYLGSFSDYEEAVRVKKNAEYEDNFSTFHGRETIKL